MTDRQMVVVAEMAGCNDSNRGRWKTRYSNSFVVSLIGDGVSRTEYVRVCNSYNIRLQ